MHISPSLQSGFIALAVGLLACAAPAARAQTVFTTGTPDNVSGNTSDTDSAFTQLETFTFGATTSFNGVEWYGAYLLRNTPQAMDAFTISLYNTTGGAPDASPSTVFTVGNAVNRTLFGKLFTSYDVYRYTSALGTTVTLGPGTYGISIVNNTAVDPDDYWAWLSSNQTGGHFTQTGAVRGARSADLAFSLVNTAAVNPVPEPSEWLAMGMAGTSVMGLMVRARRRKAVKSATVAA
ncbi:MAG: PEP-CTERM sorting domain-containing protein [Armatimonadota bacterium]